MPKYWRKCLRGEMDVHLGYEKNSVAGNNTGNSRNGSYPKKIQTEHGESVISIPRDLNGQFEPIAVPKHESRGLSIEKLVISLYAKGMSVSDIEEEMREIYEIGLSTSAISIITNKVNQAAQEWQNRPLDPVYLIARMDRIVFKVRDNGKIINKTVYLCVGLKQNGLKEVLGRIPSAPYSLSHPLKSVWYTKSKLSFPSDDAVKRLCIFRLWRLKRNGLCLFQTGA